ncbi:MAG: hypothetical protein WDN04_22695 [Rhodospirillales bacterium]
MAALLSVFGTLVFRNVVAPHVFARAEVAVVCRDQATLVGGWRNAALLPL